MNATRLVSFLLTGLCINYDVVQVARNTSIIKRETSTEEPSAEQAIPDDVCILAKDNNHALAGHHFKIATWEDWPTSYTTRDAKNRLVGHGTAFEFVEVLQEKFGFTYEVVVPEDNELGDANRGLLGMLNHKTVDFVAAFLPMTPTLMKIATPSIALAETEFVILMKRPSASATGSGLLAPFTTTVWILILVSLLAVGPIIFLIIYLRNRLLCPTKPTAAETDEKLDTGEPIYEVYAFTSCVWFVYGALLKQGSTINARSDSSRMLFATWWLFILVLTAFYTANLTAFLTLSKFTLPIEDAKGIRRGGYRWFAERGKLLQNSVLNDTTMAYLRPEQSRLNQYFLRIDGTTQRQSVVQRVEKGSLFLEERTKVEFLIFQQYMDLTRKNISESSRCTMAMTPKSFLTQTLAFFYPGNSTLKRLFDPTLLHLTEAGIVKHRQRAYLPLNQICPLNLGSNERKLQNGDLFTTYMVMACGFAAGATAFFGEHLYRCWSKRKSPKPMTIDKVFGPAVSDSSRARKRVRLKIPIQPRYPNDKQNTVVLPPGPTTKPPPFEASFNKSFMLYNGHGHNNGFGDQNGFGHQNGLQYHNDRGYQNGQAETHANVNGRDYVVLRAAGGATQLVPMRTPSALLFR